MSNGGQDLPLVKSAIRAIEVLELFSREQRPLTLSQIIEALGYPQSSATVMLKSLLAIGYLNYNRDTKTYYPNITVTKLGEWIRESSLVSGPVQRLMQDMHQRTTESISIAVQNDINVHFLSVLNSDHKIRFFIPSKGQRTLLQSNLGWMLLAPKSDKDITSIYNQIALLDAHRMPELDEVRGQIAEIRRNGYCFIPNLPVPGAASVAMLLPSRFHNQRMVVGVGGYAPRLEANLAGILTAMTASIDSYRQSLEESHSDLLEPSVIADPRQRSGLSS
jgi:DNA-binding IclR family transcriptional regulator